MERLPNRSSWIMVILALTFLLTLNGCTTEKKEQESRFVVRVLFNPNGLGDLSYNDNILRGILELQKEENYHLEFVSPANDEEGLGIIRHWQRDETVLKQYIILVGSQLENLAYQTLTSNPSSDYLLCDMDVADLPVPLFRLCGYGVSFLAGVAAHTITQSDSAVFLGGKPHENYMEDSYQGFRDGFLHAGGKRVDELYVAEDGSGFSNPMRGYQLADSLYRQYPFIYAMAGATNTGIYKYLRENPGHDYYTAGVDTDQSVYSDHIIGSMIKDTGKCTADYIKAWIRGEEIPLRRYLDLTSGYTYFEAAEGFSTRLKSVLDEKLQVAIEKEKEYVRANRQLD